jgi:hypothetical protein
MSSIARVLAVLGLAVLAVGGAAAGYGVYEQRTDTCESRHGVTAFPAAANETTESFDRVAYENLSAAEQRAFRGAVWNGSTNVVENASVREALSGKVVVYEGDRYETVVWVSDCARSYVAFVVYGGLSAAVGAVVTGGAFGWRRLKRG